MKNQTKVVIFSLLTFAVVPLSFAQNGNKSQERMEAKTKAQEQRLELRCDILSNRINNRIKTWEDNQPLRKQLYTNVKSTLEKVISNLKGKGYDVSSLEADMVKLDELISKVNSDRSAVLAQLKIAQGYACGDTADQFKTEMQKARDLIKVLQDDMKDLRDLFQNTIRPDIKAVREQVVETE